MFTWYIESLKYLWHEKINFFIEKQVVKVSIHLSKVIIILLITAAILPFVSLLIKNVSENKRPVFVVKRKYFYLQTREKARELDIIQEWVDRQEIELFGGVQ